MQCIGSKMCPYRVCFITLPISSLQMYWIPVRFFDIGDMSIISWHTKKLFKKELSNLYLRDLQNLHFYKFLTIQHLTFNLPTVPRKRFGSADCDTIYIIYSSAHNQLIVIRKFYDGRPVQAWDFFAFWINMKLYIIPSNLSVF